MFRVAMGFLVLFSFVPAAAQIVVSRGGEEPKRPVTVQSVVCQIVLDDNRIGYSAMIWVPNDVPTRQRIAREFEAYVDANVVNGRFPECIETPSYNGSPKTEGRILGTNWNGGYPTSAPQAASGFGATEQQAEPSDDASPGTAAATNKVMECHYNLGSVHRYSPVVLSREAQDIQDEWRAWVKDNVSEEAEAICSDHSGFVPRTRWDLTPFNSVADVDEYYSAAAAFGDWRYEKLDWSPKGGKKSGDETSKLKKKSVFFRYPHDDERGYGGVSFDIEYQFLVCMGELHIAYSLDPESVHIGQDRITSPLRKAHYTYKAHFYEVSPPPTHVESVPLKGKVFHEYDSLTPIGTFGDNFAGKALGFGCFSGQTKKIANMKDLGRYLSKQPTKEELEKFFDQLQVTFETNEVLTSAAAEEEIRAEIEKRATHNDKYVGSGTGDETVRELEGNKAAEERAARRAAEEAEFQAKEKAYEEGLAEHKAAVEQYEKALADAEAQKAANAAAAKAQQDAFAQKQAEYEAEVARARQAQEDYEAKYGKPQ